MSSGIRPVADTELDRVLGLITAYLEFYGVSGIGRERARAFFGRFTEGEGADREKGWLYAAWNGDEPVGFACYYLVHNSLAATDTLLLHDLYTTPGSRGQGIGRSLIETGRDLARELGAPQLEWTTAPDNRRARRLYDSTGAERSSWLSYELKT